MPDGHRIRHSHDPRDPRAGAAGAAGAERRVEPAAGRNADARTGSDPGPVAGQSSGAGGDRVTDMHAAIESAGYHPEAVGDGVADALGGEPVRGFVVHHEPTFDNDEVRRHLTVVALTPTRLVVTHTDEHPPDDLLPQPYTATSTEAVAVSAVRSVVVQRMVPQAAPEASSGGLPTEAVLTVAWGAVRRVDVEPAQCSDPECEADHGYAGSLTADDFSLRVSAAADGARAVEDLLAFARVLTASTVRT